MRQVSVLLALFAFSGCSSHVDFSSPYHLAANDRIAIAVDPTLMNKVESSSVVWEQGTYELGPALARVIDNRSDAPSRIDYVVITQSVSWFLSGTMFADYTLLVKHNVAGRVLFWKRVAKQFPTGVLSMRGKRLSRRLCSIWSLR
jgi:hypothetical protein